MFCKQLTEWDMFSCKCLLKGLCFLRGSIRSTVYELVIVLCMIRCSLGYIYVGYLGIMWDMDVDFVYDSCPVAVTWRRVICLHSGPMSCKLFTMGYT